MIDFFLCDSPIIIVSRNVFTEKVRLILVILFDFRFRRAHLGTFCGFSAFFGRLQWARLRDDIEYIAFMSSENNIQNKIVRETALITSWKLMKDLIFVRFVSLECRNLNKI